MAASKKYDFSGLWSSESIDGKETHAIAIDYIYFVGKIISCDRPHNKYKATMRFEYDGKGTTFEISQDGDFFTTIELATHWIESEASKRLDEVVEFANKIRKAE